MTQTKAEREIQQRVYDRTSKISNEEFTKIINRNQRERK